MANSTTGKVWVLDTAGLITASPVVIRKIVLLPNAAADAATFKYFNDGSASYTSKGTAQTATVSTNAVSSTGNFTAAKVSAADGINIDWTSTGNNKGVYYVVSRDSDNQVTLGAVAGAAMTDEASKLYSWTVYPSYTAAQLTSYGTEKVTEELDIDCTRFPNLILSALSSSAKVHVFIE